jgi:hypothetical protein
MSLPRHLFVRALALLPALALAACADAPRAADTALDGTYGAGVRNALALQILSPRAAANSEPVVGIDAAAALGAQARYRKSFIDEAPQTNVFTIGVSGK